MDEAGADLSIVASSTIKSKFSTRKVKSIPSVCTVCGDSAVYSFFGAISCHSCKMFFKRNAESTTTPVKCDQNGDCQVTIHNRNICSPCRLAKCFASGMRKELIRCSRQKKNTVRAKKANVGLPIVTTGAALHDQPQQTSLIACGNLLRTNLSTLNEQQWSVISNLVHCYKERHALLDVEQCMQKQNNLPIKLRFKVASIYDIFRVILGQVQEFFQSNLEFLSLCAHDRSILLRYSTENIASLGAILVAREKTSFQHTGLETALENNYGSIVMNLSRRLLEQVDSDTIFIKLGMAILVFSPSNNAHMTDNHLKNVQKVSRIQNMYAEIAWKYLLHKHDHHQAVIRFNNFINSLFLVSRMITEAHKSEDHQRIMVDLIEQISHRLGLDA